MQISICNRFTGIKLIKIIKLKHQWKFPIPFMIKFLEENFHVKMHLPFSLFHVQNQLMSKSFLIVIVAQSHVKTNNR